MMKRLLLLALELTAEAIALGCVLGAMLVHGIGLWNAMLGSTIAVPVILGLHGYYIPRVAVVLTCRSKARYLYPASASLAFTVCAVLVAQNGWTDLSLQGRHLIIPFVAIGALTVFMCSLLGNEHSRKWLKS